MPYPVGHVDVYGRQRASRHVWKLNTFAHAVGWRSPLGLAIGVDMRIKYSYISVYTGSVKVNLSTVTR
jgi:hypothetical protein